MSVKQPVIKFSPFEALLIGEKNKILKRQPMKNTIFVTRLNHRRKAINLRDLFGLEKDPKSDNKNDGIFKMPQRVCDFLKNRKLRNKNGNTNVNNSKKEILCYEFEGQKINAKNNEMLTPKGKNAKLKSNKVKFKKKYKCRDNLKEKIVRKFPNLPKRSSYYYYYNSRCRKTLPRLAQKNKRRNYNGTRHALRGKDGKFIRKSEYNELKNISTKQNYVSNYVNELYVKKNNQNVGEDEKPPENMNVNECEMPYTIKTSTELSSPQDQFDITSPESVLDEASNKYYKYNFEDFHFPKFPNKLELSDYDDDHNLLNLVYENFPKCIKFESKSFCDDFSDALLSSGILKPEKNLKIYEKKKNGFVKDGGVTVILDSHIPCLKLTDLNNIKSNQSPIKKERNGYSSSKIDEPLTGKNHLISGRSLGSFFFRSAEGKDVFIGSLVKPFLQNSWFGSLPEF